MQQLTQNISLKPFNTFGIDVTAKYFHKINSIEQLKKVLIDLKGQPKFVLGGGSNVLLTKDIDAHVLYINLKNIKISSEEGDYALIDCAAGEVWHDFVLWTIDNNLGGIENLSLIPGNAGTAPIQNIGAYGVELKDVFVSCNAIDMETLEEKTFNTIDCQFGYRDSVFKNTFKNKYVITNITLKLKKSDHSLNFSYGAISDTLKQMNVSKPSIRDISNAVIKIRKQKLPDPKMIGNSGSFFKNPVITTEKLAKLTMQFPNVPSYPVDKNQVKIPAGWLIEKAGFKGLRLGNHGVHDKQALVLVNYGGATGENIEVLSKSIQTAVKKIFNIDLIAEVNII